MSGQSAYAEPVTELDGGTLRVSGQLAPLQLLSVAPKAHFSLAEHDAALEQLSKKAGPATEAIVSRVNASFESYRRELNEAAGGQASDRVMLLAHNAQRAQLAVELQTSVSTVGYGQLAEGVDHDKKQEQVSKGLRNLVGLCAFASDLLNKAHEAALQEGRDKAKAAGSPTQQLFATIGVAGPTPAPDHTPPGVEQGAPACPSSASPITVSGESE